MCRDDDVFKLMKTGSNLIMEKNLSRVLNHLKLQHIGKLL